MQYINLINELGAWGGLSGFEWLLVSNGWSEISETVDLLGFSQIINSEFAESDIKKRKFPVSDRGQAV